MNFNKVYNKHVQRTRLMYQAACKVEFQPFNRSYSQLVFFNFLLRKYYLRTLCDIICRKFSLILAIMLTCFESPLNVETAYIFLHRIIKPYSSLFWLLYRMYHTCVLPGRQKGQYPFASVVPWVVGGVFFNALIFSFPPCLSHSASPPGSRQDDDSGCHYHHHLGADRDHNRDYGDVKPRPPRPQAQQAGTPGRTRP